MSYCTDRDPIVVAGCVMCTTCGQRSYPVDADWADDRLVLATFENGHAPGCTTGRQGHTSVTVLLDLGAEDQTISAPRPRKCRGTVRTGSRKGLSCAYNAAAGGDYCYWHDPDRQGVR